MPRRPQRFRKTRSISSAATPVTCATCRTVMPYFAQAWMRATSDGEIVGAILDGAAQVAGSLFSRGADGGGVMLKTRGLCAAGSAGAGLSASSGLATGCLGAKSASAAARALMGRWRSLPSTACCCSNRSSTEFLLPAMLVPVSSSTGFQNSSSAAVGSWGDICYNSRTLASLKNITASA
jgi:hypothetical protein